uniref:Siderophore 2,3-dihydroxybenzoate-glycine-threonine trimeric ester bacillibactin synthetase n=1 Tax=Verrucosispora sp. MS100047 TaxID=1410949 RepID=A0A097CS23_9ACTN|nr:siderophore 2,3-dihydroxybenzoate-glycine-threonine trimeric ester bacillibactin synthetase [Verrucosispora sp. MS100047]
MSDPSAGSRPLNAAQLGVWYAQRIDPGNPVHNMGGYLEIQGPLDPDALIAAVCVLVGEDETLRLRFTEVDGTPTQQLGPAPDFAPRLVDLSAEADPRAVALRHMHDDLNRPLDLEHDRLFQHEIYRLGPEHHLWYLRAHHLVQDGYSATILRRRAAELYTALVTDRGGAGAPLGSFTAMLDDQDRYVGSRAQQRDAAYWRKLMADVAYAPPAPAGKPANRVTRQVTRLDGPGFDRLREFAQRAGTTWQQALITAAVLHRRMWTGDDDVLLGLPLPGRLDPRSAATPGMMATILPLYCRVDPAQTAEELAARVAALALRAQWHQRYDGDDLRRDLGWPADQGRQFGPVINFVAGDDHDDFAGLPARYHLLSTGGTIEDVGLTVTHHPEGGLRIDVSTDTAYTQTLDLDAYQRTFHRILANMTGRPGVTVAEVEALNAADRELVLREWNATAVPVADRSLAELFTAQAAASPQAPALVCGGVVLSYGELAQRSGQLANHLLSIGVGRGDVVGVLLERDIDFAVAVVAVTRTGAAYSILDPDFPDERLSFVLRETAASALVTREALTSRVDAACPVVRVDTDAAAIAGHTTGDPQPRIDPGDVACVMFTSGSTGAPKGVLAPHRALVGTVQGQRYASFGPGEVFLQCSPVSWDAFSLEFWGALLFGGVCVLHPGQRPDPTVIAALVPEHGVSMLQLSSGLFNVLVDEYPEVFAGVRVAFTGGEPSSGPHVARVSARHPHLRVANAYGPAESMGFTTTFDVPADFTGVGVPVGRAVANKRAYVLDRHLRPVPVGVAGEIYLAGVGLADGYLNQSGVTAQRFVADPFGGDGERLYRTGDLARWSADGQLEFVGRVDGQVKVRGFRVEPGEIEAALLGHADVAQAVVLASPDGNGTLRLIAYVVPRTTGTDGAALTGWLRQRLPEHMVPSAVVLLDRIPLTANGKVDRRALPEPEFGAGPTTRRAPRDAREEILCGLYAEVLGVAEVGVDDSFFDLGGHSLLAARLAARARAVLGVELSIRDIFQSPTVAALTAGLPATGTARTRPPLVAATHGDQLPLSYAQRRLWLIDSIEGPGTTYNVPMTFRLRGALDVDALTAALGDLVDRHQVLRTVIAAVDGRPYQQLLAPAPVTVTRREATAEDLDRQLVAAAGHVFDLAAEAPLRVTLFALGDEEYELLILLHHIATDGQSLRPLLGDLATAYAARRAGRAPDWMPLPVQYADYALWQRAVLGDRDDQDSTHHADLRYWRQALAGLPEETGLPLDRPRPAVADHRGDAVAVRIDPEVARRVREVAREQRCTAFMVLQAALALTLRRFGAGTDIAIGTPIAGRSDEDLAPLVGFFVNTIVLRTDTSGNPSFADLLVRVRGADLDAFAHQELPFDLLLEDLNPVRSLARHPLFQICLGFDDATDAELHLPGLRCERGSVVVTGAAKFDLEFLLRDEGADGIGGGLVYRTAIFDEATVQRLVAALERTLRQVLADPSRPVDEVDALDPVERSAVLHDWNTTAVDVADESLAHRFAAQVAADPHAVALRHETMALTYGELDAAANRLARHLSAAGVRRGDLVGVLLERGTDFAVAVVAVVKTGAAYAVLDPEFPDERLHRIVTETGAAALVSRAALAERITTDAPVVRVDTDAALIAAQPATDPGVPVGPDDVACVMFTSGSTGAPKGILTSHRALVGTLAGQSYADFGPDQVFLQCSPVSWDAFSLEFWGALLFGGTCVLQPGQRPEPALIATLVREHRVTMLQLSSGLFNLLVDEYPQAFDGVRYAFTGGETSSVTHVARILARCPDLRVGNAYGPAESMGFSTVYPVPDDFTDTSSLPVGRAVANKRTYVLDDALRPAPVGVVGEVYLAGIGLAHGYLNQPGTTAQRFVPDPFGAPGDRLYRTGDLARWTVDGQLEFAGRLDGQVKVRGFRVEPGEIESVLRGHDQVAQAAVIAVPDPTGTMRLIAYVVGDTDPAGLRPWLRQRLPEHMVPAAVIPLDRMPLTANGKLDRRALPEPEFTAGTGRAARDAREEILCGVYAEILGVPTVSIDDDFFDLGGHSLLAAKLAARVCAILGTQLTIRDIFQAPTIAALAAQLPTAAPARSRPTLRRRTEAGRALPSSPQST